MGLGAQIPCGLPPQTQPGKVDNVSQGGLHDIQGHGDISHVENLLLTMTYQSQAT
jgi:hypothetical protein